MKLYGCRVNQIQTHKVITCILTTCNYTNMANKNEY